MKSLAEIFLTTNEQTMVTEAVKKAELLTSGEIVPLIVSQSYDYPRALLAAALTISLPLTFLVTQLLSLVFWINPENVYFFSIILLPLFLLSHFILGKYSSTTRLFTKVFISEDEMNREVEEEAVKSFFSEQLYKTRDSNGILLFISVFEQKVWILADHGIQAKIEQHAWDEIISDLTAKIGKHDHGEALCRAIERIGEILAHHFPYKKDDTDELHNLIIR